TTGLTIGRKIKRQSRPRTPEKVLCRCTISGFSRNTHEINALMNEIKERIPLFLRLKKYIPDLV
ncbi:hypothetical protein ACOIDY_35470, partial [Klebsiella pneumoniae]|uniref:hypothetical protein n=1 Tax=Klebsiella pneumoniae TaxID=573 RepID=UPI00301952BE